MKPSLVDLNLLLALLVEQHRFHRAALHWFDRTDSGDFGLCRIVQLGGIRLLANPSVMREGTLAAEAAWMLIDELNEDARVDFIEEPPELDPFFSPTSDGPARHPTT